MNARFFRNNAVARVIITIIILNFVLTSGPVGVCRQAFASHNFRKPQARGTDIGTEVANRLAMSSHRDGGANLALRTIAKLKDVLRDRGITAGFSVVDWNVGRDKNTISDDMRIKDSLDFFRELLSPDSGVTEMFVATHSGRPDEERPKIEKKIVEEWGKGALEKTIKDFVMDGNELEAEIRKLLIAEFGMAPIVARAQELFSRDEVLKDVVLVLLPVTIEDEATTMKFIEDARTANKGKKIVFVFENIRIYKAEKSDVQDVRDAFAQLLIRLTGKDVKQLFYGNEAFDKIHRAKEASMEMVKFFDEDLRAAGPKLLNDLRNIVAFEQAIKDGSISFLFGGKKFDKIKNIAALAKRVAKTKGKLIVVGAQINPYLESLGKDIGKSLTATKDKDKEAIKKGLPKVLDSKADLLVPVDFVVVEAGASKIVTADELGGEMMQVDVGPRTTALIVDHIKAMKAGDGLVLNGGAGKFDQKDFMEGWEGTKQILYAVSEVAQLPPENGTKRYFFAAGGDMVEAVNKFYAETGIDLTKIIYYSTGGGALLEVLGQGPENIATVSALIDTSAPAAALADGGSATATRPLYLVNNIDLGKGAETGSKNIWHAELENADGIIINHSEMRGFYEKIVEAGIRNIVPEIRAAFFDYEKEIRDTEKWERDQRDGIHAMAKKGRIPESNKQPTLDVLDASVKERKDKALERKQQWEVAAKKIAVGLDGKSGFFAFLKTTASLYEKDLGIKIGDGAIDKETKMVVDWDKVEIGRLKVWLDELGRNQGDERALKGFAYGSDAALTRATVDMVKRRVVNKIMRELLVQSLEFKKRRPGFVIVLCHGETADEFNDARSDAVNRQDLQEILEDIAWAVFIGAYEPRFAIGTGLVPSNEHIAKTQILSKVTVIEKIGQEMPELYGGSVTKDNARPIFSIAPQDVWVKLPGAQNPVKMLIRPVNGGLIGGAGLARDTIEPVFKTGQELFDETGEAFYVYLNHKANDPGTKLAASVYDYEFAEMFQGVDFNKVHAAIGSPIPSVIKEKVQTPLDNAQKRIRAVHETLRANIASVTGFFRGNKAAFDATGGRDYSAMITGLFAPVVVSIEGKEAEDSKGNPTVGVELSIGAGLSTKGFVPAGTSTGLAEAATKAVAIARQLVSAVSDILAKANIDLRSHEDLIRAEELIIKEANNYAALPANTTVPVSWAMWRMAAKLNNMELWQYMRDKVPGIIGQDNVEYLVNIFNGGLHALLPGEVMGVDKIEIQETLLKTVGNRSEREKIRMNDRVDKEYKKILVAKYGIENVTRATEAGFSVKGLGDFDEMLGLLVQAIINAGYAPGKDFQISLDVAASNFARFDEKKNTYIYTFQGKDRTSQEMIQYYINLVQRHRGLIASIEDGLHEEDWDSWFALTGEMTKLGVLTIGDDLFVTQMERLKKGIRIGKDGKVRLAASGILIKVNQNGSVWGTMQVMEFAKSMGMKSVVSHRSKETLDDGIADLAYAANVWAIKTGDTQPEYDFPDPSTWVRRVKYLRLKAIELGQRALKITESQKKALVISDTLVPSSYEEIALLASMPNLRLAVSGGQAKKMKKLLGNADITVAADPLQAIKALAIKGISKENVVYLRSAEDVSAAAVIAQEVVANEVRTLSFAKALQVLFGNRIADAAFKAFVEKLDGTVITADTEKDMQDILAEVKKGTFAFSDGVKVVDTVRQKVAEARKRIETFVKEI